MSIICTDAGHGGNKPGAVWGEVMEKDLNLLYTTALNEELKRRGHSVLTTRRSDSNVPPLKIRCQLINKHHREKSPEFDAIISIHCNVAVARDRQSGGYNPVPSRRGFYAIYSQESADSTAFAKSIAKECKKNGIALSHGGIISTGVSGV